MNENQNRPGSSAGKRPKKKKNPMPRHIFRAIATVLMICTIIGCIVGCYMTLFVFDILQSSEVIQLDLDLLKLNYTTIIYAEDKTTGEFVEQQRLVGNEGSRVWVDYEKMPPHLFDALIAVEDKRFMDHTGVDWYGTTNSFVKLALGKIGLGGSEDVRGASTITQQLVRNITGDNEFGIPRKLREIFRALKLEQFYSKDQILESYLNTVPFGNNTNGIQAAANLYFNKDVAELTVSECASIVGITKSPTFYNPYLSATNNTMATDGSAIDGITNNQERKEDILFFMHQQGKLTDAEYKDAENEVIVFSTENNAKRTSTTQSYFIDYLMEQVIDDLAAAKQITREEATLELYRGGFRIYSTEDTSVQTKLEAIYLDQEKLPKVNNKDEYPQSAFIITDPNGAIRGLVGGIGEKSGARVLNRAAASVRQPGSTIKPISSYALAFEKDLVTWSSLLLDGPYSLQIENQPPWRPKDYYGAPKGYMILEEALQRSTNLIPVRLVEMLSPKAVWEFLHDTLNITTLAEADKAPSPMSLGALTNGVTPLEMAGAYQMYANGGTYTPPYTYTKVLDSKGTVILQRNVTPTRVISFDTATIINKLMQRVVNAAPGTGRAASLAKTNPGMPVAGKTGTTDEDVDQWFIGMSPYYVGVCWMGFDDPHQTTTDAEGNKTTLMGANGKPLPHSIHYSSYPPPILWNTVMTSVHEGMESKQFPTSSNVVSVTYCMETGYAASTSCTKTSTGWYKTTNIPSVCPVHGFNGFVGPDVPAVINMAGYKPWLDAEAPYTAEWAWMYPNVQREFGADGLPVIPDSITDNPEE